MDLAHPLREVSGAPGDEGQGLPLSSPTSPPVSAVLPRRTSSRSTAGQHSGDRQREHVEEETSQQREQDTATPGVNFQVGILYWFKYTARHALPGFKHQYFAGKVTHCTDKMATWTWKDGEVGNSTRQISTLISQGTEALTDKEREVLYQHDDGGSMTQIRDIIRARVQFSSQPPHSQQGCPDWKDISFTGFTEWENRHKWVRLICDWLPKFDPTAFLTRCH